MLQRPSVNLMDQVRQTLIAGGRPFEATKVVGKESYLGYEVEFELDFLPDGRFSCVTSGPQGHRIGFDGATVWKQDCAGLAYLLDFTDRDREVLLGSLMSSSWVLPNSVVQAKSVGDFVELQLKDSEQCFRLTVDPNTHLPTRADLHGGGDTVLLGDWRAVGDRLIPMHVELKSENEPRTFSGATAKSTNREGVKLALPKTTVTDTFIDLSLPPTIPSRPAGKNHIAIHPLINGKDVGWFILDSGSGVMLIDKEIANSLHLKKVSKDTGTGVGGTVESFGRLVSEFKAGPATVRDLTFQDFDMTQIGGPTKPFAGIIGTPLLRRMILKLDWNVPSVEVYDRERYTLSKGSWIPIRFDTNNPVVLAQVAGTPKAWYRLDTGGAGFLTVHSPFVNRWKLLENRTTTDSSSNGIGGQMPSKLGTIDWFEVAGHRFEHPKVEFSLAERGSFANTYLAGNIGIALLRQYTLILDFSGQRIAFLDTTSH
ncbi:MAG: aspartyl protease family protein [Armatimonadetes bacterium]|nr:aspartyl protease family protein [Armatimonadota bacterium]